MTEEVLDPPQVFGAYLLLAALGRGAMGDVFLARPLSRDRGVPSPVVVKRLHGELADKPGFVSRFRHEAAVAVCVDSPHVAQVYDVGAVGDTLYIALEYVPGWPLSKVLDAVLKSGRHASVASVVDLIAGGLEGLHALHTARDAKTNKPLDIVHRDLSPKNLMVGEDGRMRVIDLGLGKSNAQDWRTRTGVVMGSVGYMPPEQVRGERVDARADVFAMGVVAFEMLALRNYIPRGSISLMMEASAAPSFVRPSEFRPDVPKDLDRVIERSLQLDRNLRFSTAEDFLNALRELVPQAYTAGSMVNLLEEIFGDSRQIRAAKLTRLLSGEPPDDFETRPTKIFGLRAGVVPAETNILSRLDQPEERTALTQLSNGGATATGPGETPDSLPRTVQMNGPQAGRGTGISIPVLLGAVLAAAVLGGLVSVVLLLAVLENREVRTTSSSVVPTPKSRPRVTDRPPSGFESPAAPETLLERRPKGDSADSDRRKIVAKKVPGPKASAPQVRDEVDVALERLAARARARRETATTSAMKSSATQIILDVALWRRSKDDRRKRKAIRELEARLSALQ